MIEIVMAIIFGSIFGIFYLFFTTRNRERMALIEKGESAQLFSKGDKRKSPHYSKVFVINLSLLMIGIGMGLLLGNALTHLFGVDKQLALIASIILCAGLGLLTAFKMIQKLEKE